MVGDVIVFTPSSHPSWVRGLKFDYNLIIYSYIMVAPFMGAWIEIGIWKPITELLLESHPSWVRGLKYFNAFGDGKTFKSHPSWVRGLKLVYGNLLRNYY